MKRYYTYLSAVALAAVVGCGGDQQDKPVPKARGYTPSTNAAQAKADKKEEPPAKTSEAPKTVAAPKTGSATPGGVVEATGLATLKGKVTFDGTPPAPKDLGPSMTADRDHCLKGPTQDPLWSVGPDGGVKGVVVWLRAPKGKAFRIPPEQQKRTDTVVMDQPFCLFEPHVVAANTYFWDVDSKVMKPTEQKFIVKNSAPINHNTSYTPRNKLVNSGRNELIKAKGELVLDVKPGNKAGDEELLSISCDIHKWMTAKALIFDHPFYAVTNEKGEYEIKNAPAGAEVLFTYWHESFGDKRNDAREEPITLQVGENTKDIKIK